MEKPHGQLTEVKNILLGLLIISPYLLASIVWAPIPKANQPPPSLLLWVLLLYPFVTILVLWIISLIRSGRHNAAASDK